MSLMLPLSTSLCHANAGLSFVCERSQSCRSWHSREVASLALQSALSAVARVGPPVRLDMASIRDAPVVVVTRNNPCSSAYCRFRRIIRSNHGSVHRPRRASKRRGRIRAAVVPHRGVRVHSLQVGGSNVRVAPWDVSRWILVIISVLFVEPFFAPKTEQQQRTLYSCSQVSYIL